jgi:Uma2 family endonuclease
MIGSFMQPARGPDITEAMYLAMERVAPTKHEYVDGEVRAMAGASPRHNRLAVACSAQLDAVLRGRDCAPLSSDQRVHVPATGDYCYPDVTVICGEPRYHAEDPDSLTNPRLIVEVLSRSTEKHERGVKFEAYRSIPSFEEYVLVSQDQVKIEVRRRESERKWTIEEYGAGDVITLASVGATLDVDSLYEDAFRFRGEEPKPARG